MLPSNWSTNPNRAKRREKVRRGRMKHIPENHPTITLIRQDREKVTLFPPNKIVHVTCHACLKCIKLYFICCYCCSIHLLQLEKLRHTHNKEFVLFHHKILVWQIHPLENRKEFDFLNIFIIFRLLFRPLTLALIVFTLKDPWSKSNCEVGIKLFILRSLWMWKLQ